MSKTNKNHPSLLNTLGFSSLNDTEQEDNHTDNQKNDTDNQKNDTDNQKNDTEQEEDDDQSSISPTLIEELNSVSPHTEEDIDTDLLSSHLNDILTRGSRTSVTGSRNRRTHITPPDTIPTTPDHPNSPSDLLPSPTEGGDYNTSELLKSELQSELTSGIMSECMNDSQDEISLVDEIIKILNKKVTKNKSEKNILHKALLLKSLLENKDFEFELDENDIGEKTLISSISEITIKNSGKTNDIHKITHKHKI